MKWVRTFVIFGLIMAGVGCQVPTAGPLDAVQPVSNYQRVGNVYLVRGFIGVFSFGIDDLCEQLEEQGIRANVYQDTQATQLAETIAEKYRNVKNPEPLILIGHSYGADDVIYISRRLAREKIEVDLMVTLDPVTPENVPGNVKQTFNIFRSNGVMDNLPWLRGIPLKQDQPGMGKLDNIDIRENPELREPNTNHFNIEKNKKIQHSILEQAIKVCPPRVVWDARFLSPVSTIMPVEKRLYIPAATLNGPAVRKQAGNGNLSVNTSRK